MKKFARLTPIEKIVACLSIALCLYFLFTFLLLVLGNFWPGPLFDYWVDIPLIEKHLNHQLAITDLVTAHNNAHRIAIPRLLFILDYDYFAGTNVLPITASLICKLSLILLFNYLLKSQSLQTKLLLNALVFAAMLNAGNVYNVIFNFDIQWDLVSVFACFAIFFYNNTFEYHNRFYNRLLAYLFLGLAFFSHAGALSLPFVFIIISIINKKTIETIANIALLSMVFYLNSVLPVADPENPDVQSALVTLILHADAVFLFITKFISGSLVFYLGTAGYYVSAYVFLLLLTSLVLLLKGRRRNADDSNHVFLYFSLFLFLMVLTIAAARSTFSPNVWAASRFQTTVLLFILCLHIHLWLLVKPHLQTALLLHGFVIFFLIHYFTYNIPCKLSNVVFFSHAYMLTHERNQDNAPRLLLWLHNDDVIANSDALFRKNGFAWYANKQGTTRQGKDFIDTGKTLIDPDRMPAFAQSCSEHTSALNYQHTQEGGIEFATPINIQVRRKTYYALDQTGVVVGFAYIFASETGLVKNYSLQGYSISDNIGFIAETNDHGQPECLYAIAQHP